MNARDIAEHLAEFRLTNGKPDAPCRHLPRCDPPKHIRAEFLRWFVVPAFGE